MIWDFGNTAMLEGFSADDIQNVVKRYHYVVAHSKANGWAPSKSDFWRDARVEILSDFNYSVNNIHINFLFYVPQIKSIAFL